MVTPAARREAVAHLRQMLEVSERRACMIVGANRTSVRCRSRRPDDTELRTRLRALAAERRRFGYRRLHVLLRRDGVLVNRKKTQRIYREEGLSVRRRRGRKRAVGARAPARWPCCPTSAGASTSSTTSSPRGEKALTAFEAGTWGRKYPAIGQSWRRAWSEIAPFYAFPAEVRKVLYATNAVEALNAKLRRAVRARGHFPTDEAAMKMLYLVLNRSEKDWIMPPREWSMAKAQFAVIFGERFDRPMAA